MGVGELIKKITETLNLVNLNESLAEVESQAKQRHDEEVFNLIPILAPLFGLAVLLFSVWDFLIDPAHAWLAFIVRLVLVMAGSVAYLPTRLRWSPIQRCGFIYCTHSCAIIISEFLLRNGFLHGLTGIAATVFLLSVVTMRMRSFLLIRLSKRWLKPVRKICASSIILAGWAERNLSACCRKPLNPKPRCVRNGCAAVSR